ncbi:MAG: hypothetical protein ACRD8O_00060 [Bryobacteraceae bacterium]
MIGLAWPPSHENGMPGKLLGRKRTVLRAGYTMGSMGAKLFLNEQLNPTIPTSLQRLPQTAAPIPAIGCFTLRDHLLLGFL